MMTSKWSKVELWLNNDARNESWKIKVCKESEWIITQTICTLPTIIRYHWQSWEGKSRWWQSWSRQGSNEMGSWMIWILPIWWPTLRQGVGGWPWSWWKFLMPICWISEHLKLDLISWHDRGDVTFMWVYVVHLQFICHVPCQCCKSKGKANAPLVHFSIQKAVPINIFTILHCFNIIPYKKMQRWMGGIPSDSGQMSRLRVKISPPLSMDAMSKCQAFLMTQKLSQRSGHTNTQINGSQTPGDCKQDNVPHRSRQICKGDCW